MDLHSCDVLIVGGGGAGLRAAIAVAETYPRLRVSVISKVYPMRSHTVSAEGGAAAVIKAADSLDEHAYDTMSGSDWLSDQDASQRRRRPHSVEEGNMSTAYRRARSLVA